ncbi:MAG TPA: ATP-binding protein [Vicinamibacterales bacterium]|nr:ATP-binding protein [Vicinamibacterales bacterium]
MSRVAADWRKALLTSSLDAVILMDAGGRLIDFNDEASTLFLLTREEAIGKLLGDLIVPPDLRKGHREGLQRFLATGVSRIIGKRIEIDAIRTDGARFPVELTVAMIADESPIFVAHIRNVHERKMAERRLLATAAVSRILSNEKSPENAVRGVLRALGESMQWSLVQYWTVADDRQALRLRETWTDPHTSDADVSENPVSSFRSGEGLPGKTWQTATAQWIEDIPGQQWLERLDTLKAKGFRTGLAFPVVLGGEVIAVIEAFARERSAQQPELLAVLQAMGGQLGHFIEELHARKETERARHEAEEANRLKDEFLSVASHELRTPLNAVLGWAHLLRKGRLTGDAAARAVEAIERNVLIQARLVGDLLDMSRIIAGKFALQPASIEPMEAVRAALEVVRPAAEAKQIAISVTSDTRGRIRGDVGRLQQVFWNVLANAVKFTPNRGSIHIRGVQETADVVITVEDTGVGITPDFTRRAFERFAQANQQAGHGHGGLGLGLSIARQFVELHGGTISLHSGGEDQGTTVTVRLPLEHPVERPAPSLQGIELTRVKILVVSDENRQDDCGVFEVLERAGASVERASSPAEALGCLSRSHFDVVVSDLRITDESLWLGGELVAQPPMRSRAARSLAIVNSEAEFDAATQEHFAAVLRRPVEPTALVEAVRTLI